MTQSEKVPPIVSKHEKAGRGATAILTTQTRSVAFDSDEASVRWPTRAIELAPGHTIGQYELIRLLGRGGMGQVHLARDLRLGRLVALKLMIAQRPSHNQRFLGEARATAQCHHENIVVIHEVDEHDGHPYMVLEYLEGQTLRQWLREHAAAAAVSSPGAPSPGRAPVPPGRAVELMLPVVRALAYAHEQGIVHRDLKPENILLTRTGIIKVLDFGVAKLLSAPTSDDSCEAGHSAEAATAHSSALIGTLPYMSPEQMEMGVIDHRTDLWAVGVMLFEMVTGAHPVPSRSMADLLGIADLSTPMPCVREAMPDAGRGLGPLAAVIDRCLRKDRERRPASARELLAELEALAPGRHTAPVGEGGSPFAGLAAFQEADADRFFGRDHDIEQIVNELRSRPLVAVVGPSGTGKSSLVRAGVIPALKRSGEGWDAYIVRPGRAPLAALAAVADGLAQVHDPSESIARLRTEPGYFGARLRARAAIQLRRILVFVDQLEELYTLGAPPDERTAFLAALIAAADDAASPLRVIVSMRSDFLDRLAEDRRLGAEVTRGLVLLPPMGREGMCEALRRPVEATEYRFESPALVDRMVEALAATPGALPLLQFTAARLWELRDRERRLLTEASYERLGGVAGALASHADAVLAGMSSAQQALARVVLERLVTAERTRALVSMSELGALHRDPGAVDDVVQHLAAMRLLAIERGAEGADPTVELVHESLIDRWPRLARWLAENQDDAAFLARLRNAAQQWEKHGRDDGLLWRGAPVHEARLWLAHYRGALPRREQDYLHSVLSLDTRTIRRRRQLVAGTALLVLLVAFVWIRNAEQEASRQAMLSQNLEQALQREQAQNQATEQARREAEEARRAAEVEAARARAALATAELARADAEHSRDDARSAAARASAERAKADQAARAARQAQATAQDAEARSRAEKAKADQAAREAARSERDKQAIIDRAVGDIKRTVDR
jgi:serine/threonine protein kinase